MKKYLCVTVCLILTLTLLTLTSCSESNNNAVSLDGSTSMEKVIGALGESFKSENEGIKFTYNPTGSGSGIKAVSEGRCDIGLSSRKLKDEEKSEGLKETVLAYDGIAVIVNIENTVSDID
ncbi:MAG: substrate-binding domain-containing protein, partial [Oscillospiraceae bacterium]|nr:substrate-binding domain-containing protein [Oscillospiraceae bacterium]